MPPTLIFDALNSVRRRARMLSLAYGVGIVVASAMALLVGVVLIDWLLNLQSFPRVLVMLVSLVGLGYLLYRFVVKPALTKLSLSDVAGKLENIFPQ